MIYYVEDDTNIRELTLYALRKAGLEAEGFPSGEPFMAACAKSRPDLVLLDIMLPGISGLELLERIRSNPAMADIPVMMLTAKGTEYDTVQGEALRDDGAREPLQRAAQESRTVRA